MRAGLGVAGAADSQHVPVLLDLLLHVWVVPLYTLTHATCAHTTRPQVLSISFFLDSILAGLALQRMGDVAVRVGIKARAALITAVSAWGCLFHAIKARHYSTHLAALPPSPVLLALRCMGRIDVHWLHIPAHSTVMHAPSACQVYRKSFRLNSTHGHEGGNIVSLVSSDCIKLYEGVQHCHNGARLAHRAHCAAARQSHDLPAAALSCLISCASDLCLLCALSF